MRENKLANVIMEHNKLGSGFKITMNDIKIRGEGAILAVSQADHISAVSYELFLKLIEEAVNNIKGKSKQDFIDTEINLSIPALISEDYISNIAYRLTTYRKLAKTKQLKDLYSLGEELIDCFGAMQNIYYK